MKKIRIGNDIAITWAVRMRGGEPYDLSGKNLALMMSSMYGTERVSKFSVNENLLTFVFYGKDQQRTGRYSLILVENRGEKGMVTVDVCEPFQLVSRSCMADDGNSCGNVSVESLSIESSVDMTAIKPIIPAIGENGNWWVDGKDTGVHAQGDKGDPFRFEDFTTEQIYQLQRPALDAARIVEEKARQWEQAEDERVKAEQARTEAESKRADSELARANAERGREASEAGRVSAENTRVTSEDNRNDSERSRAGNEETRCLNEARRVGSEERRETDFVNMKTAISQAINDTDAVIDKANQASDRVKQAEAERVEAEQARALAEQSRSTAETNREKAEQKRQADSASAVKSANDAAAKAAQEATEAKKQGDYAKAQANILNDNNQKYDTIKQTVDTMEANGNALTLDIAEGKKIIAEAITEKGVPTSSTDSYQKMADNIGQIYKGIYDELFKINIDDSSKSPEVERIGTPVFANWLEDNTENIMAKDGAINYKLDRTDSFKRMNGLPSVVDGSDGDVMIRLPRFWYSIVKTATGMTYTFSPTIQASEGWHESPEIWAGASEGVVEVVNGKNVMRSCFNLDPRFRGGANNASWDALTKSLLGMPRTSLSHEAFRAACANKGSFDTGVYHPFSYLLYYKMNMMFWCIYGTRNWQADFSGYDANTGKEKRNNDGFKYGGLGRGVVDCGGWWLSFNGNNPFIRADVSYDYGVRSGTKEYSVNIGTVEEPKIQIVNVPIFLGIANPFGHIFKGMDGITKQVVDRDGVIMEIYGLFYDPKKFVSAGTNGADVVIELPGSSGGMIKRMNEYLLPVECGNGANESTYWGDQYWSARTPNNFCVFHGGNASFGGQCGGVSVPSNLGVGHTHVSYGGRLCFSPS